MKIVRECLTLAEYSVLCCQTNEVPGQHKSIERKQKLGDLDEAFMHAQIERSAATIQSAGICRHRPGSCLQRQDWQRIVNE